MSCARPFMGAWLFFAALLLPAASPAVDVPYTESLVSRAERMRLHEERGWHVLLHYRPSLIHGRKSLIDDPEFFNALEGKTNPRAELSETIRAFGRTETAGAVHPQCRFAARYRWLKERLGFDPGRLPEQPCRELREFMEKVNPMAAALVFPESHMNSPASMFGHTLIRIDSMTDSKLISHAVNYAAVTGEHFGLLYAVRGIFGLYKGYFSFMPYYEKIKDYSYMENRDIWEYRLNLSEEEVRRMALHIWEMQDIYSDYYFFSDNCSYALLFLLEAARPEINLTREFSHWVIPVETIRAVKEKGLVAEAVFRPSRASKIRHIEDLTARKYRKLAGRLARDGSDASRVLEEPAAGNEDRIRTLDLASEYLQYMSAKKKLEKSVYTGRFLAVLKARSRLGKLSYTVPSPTPPEKGHGSSRVAVGWGMLDKEDY